jgi:hypothetical protein
MTILGGVGEEKTGVLSGFYSAKQVRAYGAQPLRTLICVTAATNAACPSSLLVPAPPAQRVGGGERNIRSRRGNPRHASPDFQSGKANFQSRKNALPCNDRSLQLAEKLMFSRLEARWEPPASAGGSDASASRKESHFHQSGFSPGENAEPSQNNLPHF